MHVHTQHNTRKHLTHIHMLSSPHHFSLCPSPSHSSHLPLSPLPLIPPSSLPSPATPYLNNTLPYLTTTAPLNYSLT